MALNIEKLRAEAQRLATERGHSPDDTDLDSIVEDAITLAQRGIETEQVLRVLDLLISKDGMTCNCCRAVQDCTDSCELRPFSR